MSKETATVKRYQRLAVMASQRPSRSLARALRAIPGAYLAFARKANGIVMDTCDRRDAAFFATALREVRQGVDERSPGWPLSSALLQLFPGLPEIKTH